MNTTNFKLFAETTIEDHLNKILSGKIRLKVYNQFDDTVCDSALEVLRTDEEAIEKAVEFFGNADYNNLTTMTLAHYLSKFEVPELESGWVD